MSGTAKANILVVDDEANIRRLMTDVLKKFGGYSVDSAVDGAQAVFLLEKANYACDLLVTDLQMPGLGGLELAARAQALRPGLGVVVVTAYDDDESAVDSLKGGALDYIRKPIEVKKFLASIEGALKAAKSLHIAKDDMLEVEAPVSGWMEVTAPSDIDYMTRVNRFVTHLKSLPIDDKEREVLMEGLTAIGEKALKAGDDAGARLQRVKLSFAVFAEQVILMIEDREGRDINFDAIFPPGSGDFRALRRFLDDVIVSENGSVLLMSKKFSKPPQGDSAT